MPDLDFALRLSAPESTLAVGGLVLLMLGAFMGEKSAKLVSILSVCAMFAPHLLQRLDLDAWADG